MSIVIVIEVNACYLVGTSRWENLCKYPSYCAPVWVNTILSDIDITTILPRYEGFCMIYRHECFWKHKHRQIPSNTIPCWYQNLWNPPYWYPDGMNKVIPTYSPPAPSGTSHQWTVSNNTRHTQWLSLAKLELKVAHVGVIRWWFTIISVGGLLVPH